MYDLGLRIKEIRKKRGLSQRELARRINKSYSVVCGYESNAQLPPLDVADSIAKVLNTSLDYLVGTNEEKIYSMGNLSGQQKEILEMLFAEFSKAAPKSKELSTEQIVLIQKIICCFLDR